nr:MAG TPA: hypothetical protein [Caudoviricetes sp.]
MQTVPYEKMHAIQSEIIKKQEREINRLRESNRILEATAQTLAEALSQALSREGRDRVFVPVREIKPSGASFRVEQTIDGDVLLIRA